MTGIVTLNFQLLNILAWNIHCKEVEGKRDIDLAAEFLNNMWDIAAMIVKIS